MRACEQTVFSQPLVGKRRAFTLAEVMIVVAVVATVSAITYPIVASSVLAAKKVRCESNLKQIAMSVHLYAMDYDDVAPRATDPIDKYRPVSSDPAVNASVHELPLIGEILVAYAAEDLFECPFDRGYYVEPIEGSHQFIPNAFERYGFSYTYRTEYGLGSVRLSSIARPSTSALSSDGSGYWHGLNSTVSISVYPPYPGFAGKNHRYIVSFWDGHVKKLGHEEYFAATDFYTPLHERDAFIP